MRRLGALNIGCGWLLALSCAMASAAGPATLERAVTVDVAAQSVPGALIQLSRQAEIQIIMPAHALDGASSPAVRGRMSMRSALEKILGAVPHQIRTAQENTVTIEVTDATAGERR